MKPGGFRTVTALFIMILPDKDGADEAGEMPMWYEPNTGAKDFLYFSNQIISKQE